jgi:hypothetical protein
MENDNVGKCGHAKCAGGKLCYEKGAPMSAWKPAPVSQPVIGYMESLTIEVTLNSEGGYTYKVWPRGLEEIVNTDDADDEGNDNGGLCTGNMGDAVEMATEAALSVVRAHFSDNVWNNDVCPSSLDENGEPMTDGETAHKTTDGRECDECGADLTA